MKIRNRLYKEICFEPHEREKVSKHIKRLVENGWLLTSGGIKNDIAHGETGECIHIECSIESELIQLHK